MLSVLTVALMLAAAPEPAPLAAPEPDPHQPFCEAATHQRLIVRPHRDLCAPTLAPDGRPVDTGFIAPVCRDSAARLVFDVAGDEDRCRPPDPPQP